MKDFVGERDSQINSHTLVEAQDGRTWSCGENP